LSAELTKSTLSDCFLGNFAHWDELILTFLPCVARKRKQFPLYFNFVIFGLYKKRIGNYSKLSITSSRKIHSPR